LNSRNDGPKGQGIQSIIITNAPDLNETNFACWTSEKDNTATELKFKYNSDLQNLEISTTEGTPI